MRSISRSPSEEGAIDSSTSTPAATANAMQSTSDISASNPIRSSFESIRSPLPPKSKGRELFPSSRGRELFPDAPPSSVSNSNSKIDRNRYKRPSPIPANKEESKGDEGRRHSDRDDQNGKGERRGGGPSTDTPKEEGRKISGDHSSRRRSRSRSRERDSKSYHRDRDKDRDRKEREKDKDQETNGSTSRHKDDEDRHSHRKSSSASKHGESSSRRDREHESRSHSSRKNETEEERAIRKEKERDRDKEREKDKSRDKDRDRERDRSRERERERDRDRDRDRDRGRDKGRERDRDRHSRKRSRSTENKVKDKDSSKRKRISDSYKDKSKDLDQRRADVEAEDESGEHKSKNSDQRRTDVEEGEAGEYDLEEGEDRGGSVSAAVSSSRQHSHHQSNGKTLDVSGSASMAHKRRSITPFNDSSTARHSERSARRSGEALDAASAASIVHSSDRSPTKRYDSASSATKGEAAATLPRRPGNSSSSSNTGSHSRERDHGTSSYSSRDQGRSATYRSRYDDTEKDREYRSVPPPREDPYQSHRDRDYDRGYYDRGDRRRDWRDADDAYEYSGYGYSTSYVDADNPRYNERDTRRQSSDRRDRDREREKDRDSRERDLYRDRDSNRSRSPIPQDLPYDNVPKGPKFGSRYQDRIGGTSFSSSTSALQRRSIDSPPRDMSQRSPPVKLLKRREDAPAEDRKRLKSLGETSVGSFKDGPAALAATRSNPSKPESTSAGDEGEAMEIDSGGEEFTNDVSANPNPIPTGPSDASIPTYEQTRASVFNSASSASVYQQQPNGFGHPLSQQMNGPGEAPPSGPSNDWSQPQFAPKPFYHGPPPPFANQIQEPIIEPGAPPIHAVPAPSAPSTQIPGSTLASSSAPPPPSGFAPPSSSFISPTSKPRLKPRSADFIPGAILRRNRPKPLPLSQREFWGCSKFSDYELGKKLGQGTFGMVMKARHKRTGIQVALKKVTIHQEKDGMPITALREVKLLKKLNHPAIVPVFDMAYSGKDVFTGKTGEIYMVEPYMDHDLNGMLENPNIMLQGDQIKLYMKQLLEGTLYMHKNKILHRDMKAANLLINNEGQLQIADFGLARPYYDPGEAWKSKGWKGGLINYTAMVVTRWYRPPELLAGEKKYGPPIDMWGLGCILAEMVSRQPIFKGSSELDQMHLIAKLCGSPNESTYPGWDSLTGVKNADPSGAPDKNPDIPGEHWFGQYERRVKQYFSDPRGLLVPPLCADLIDKLLVLDPRQRLTAQEALEHPYFWTKPYPADPSSLPKYEASKELDKIDRNRKHHHAQQQQHQHQQQHQQQVQQQHQLPNQKPHPHYNPGGPAHPQMRGSPPNQNLPRMGFNQHQQVYGGGGFPQSNRNHQPPPPNPYQPNGHPLPSNIQPPVPLGMQGSGNTFHQPFSRTSANLTHGLPQPPQPSNQRPPPPSHSSLPPRPAGFR